MSHIKRHDYLGKHGEFLNERTGKMTACLVTGVLARKGILIISYVGLDGFKIDGAYLPAEYFIQA